MVIALLLFLLFGAVIGWLAGKIMKLKSTLLWSIVLGIVGSFVGGFVASLLGFGSFGGSFEFSIINMLIAIGGACLVIIVARVLKIVK